MAGFGMLAGWTDQIEKQPKGLSRALLPKFAGSYIRNVRAFVSKVIVFDKPAGPVATATRALSCRFGKAAVERANEPKEIISVAGGGHLVLGLTEVFVRVRERIDTKPSTRRTR
jgi:hypothetical protein